MHEEVISKKARQLLISLDQKPFTRKFYLAGGTALALHYGHRRSVDLDFFCSKSFSTKKIKNELSNGTRVRVTLEEEGTFIIELNGVKTSFFAYRYPVLFPFRDFHGVSVADPRDIACMKLDAISGRGSRKDFIDLYFILHQYPLAALLRLFAKKFRATSYSSAHLLKSLVYFADADKDPMPRMVTGINWSKTKKELAKIVKAYITE